MLFKTALLSAMAALATAYTQPDYSKDPSGNAIVKPGLNDLVTAGEPYTIQWEPTTQGPVSLVLLRGPSTNVKPIDTLAEGIENSGHFDWVPSTSLEADTTHYGLLLVVEGTGQYQYSTQFGVKNDNPGAGSSTPVSSPVPVTTDAPPLKSGEPGQFNQETVYSTATFVTTKCPKCSSEASSAAAAATSSAIATAPASPSTFASIPVIASSSSSSSPAPSSSSSSIVVSASSVPVIPSSVAAATGSSSGGASASASKSAPSSLFTGAADRNTVGMGAVAAGMLAALVI